LLLANFIQTLASITRLYMILIPILLDGFYNVIFSNIFKVGRFRYFGPLLTQVILEKLEIEHFQFSRALSSKLIHHLGKSRWLIESNI